jgi:hypothetical protein
MGWMLRCHGVLAVRLGSLIFGSLLRVGGSGPLLSLLHICNHLLAEPQIDHKQQNCKCQEQKRAARKGVVQSVEQCGDRNSDPDNAPAAMD